MAPYMLVSYASSFLDETLGIPIHVSIFRFIHCGSTTTRYNSGNLQHCSKHFNCMFTAAKWSHFTYASLTITCMVNKAM